MSTTARARRKGSEGKAKVSGSRTVKATSQAPSKYTTKALTASKYFRDLPDNNSCGSYLFPGMGGVRANPDPKVASQETRTHRKIDLDWPNMSVQQREETVAWCARWGTHAKPRIVDINRDPEEFFRSRLRGREGYLWKCLRCRWAGAKMPGAPGLGKPEDLEKVPIGRRGPSNEEILPCGCDYLESMIEAWAVSIGILNSFSSETKKRKADSETVRKTLTNFVALIFGGRDKVDFAVLMSRRGLGEQLLNANSSEGDRLHFNHNPSAGVVSDFERSAGRPGPDSDHVADEEGPESSEDWNSRTLEDSGTSFSVVGEMEGTASSSEDSPISMSNGEGSGGMEPCAQDMKPCVQRSGIDVTATEDRNTNMPDGHGPAAMELDVQDFKSSVPNAMASSLEGSGAKGNAPIVLESNINATNVPDRKDGATLVKDADSKALNAAVLTTRQASKTGVVEVDIDMQDSD